MQEQVLIWGASGHALVVADILRLQGYQVAGYLDDVHPERHGQEFNGGLILGSSSRLKLLHEQGIRHLIVAVGNCAARLRLADTARAAGFLLVTAIHPGAVIAASVLPGEGSVVAAGAVINPGATIGANAIINTCASVDHECVLEAGVHLSPGVRLGGGVHIGRAAWIGIGATVIDHIRVGDGSLIGAGAVVVDDIPDSVIAYGVPARIIRQVET
jgi:UDP-N-acetylbacillosamine N-acetyltransferase